MSTTSTAASDDDLARRARDGNRNALEELLRRHYDSLRAVCHRIVIDSGNADDAMQNAAISIARGIRSFDGHASVKTWMHRVAVNASLDEIRRTRRRPVLTSLDALDAMTTTTSGSRTDTVSAIDARILVRNGLLELDPEFRTVLVLRHIAELEYDEIARELDVPVGTVKSRISRGRQQLAAIIGNNDGSTTRQP